MVSVSTEDRVVIRFLKVNLLIVSGMVVVSTGNGGNILGVCCSCVDGGWSWHFVFFNKLTHGVWCSCCVDGGWHWLGEWRARGSSTWSARPARPPLRMTACRSPRTCSARETRARRLRPRECPGCRSWVRTCPLKEKRVSMQLLFFFFSMRSKQRQRPRKGWAMG